jgi:hypothetical protein
MLGLDAGTFAVDLGPWVGAVELDMLDWAQSLAVWSAYIQWCTDRGLPPISHARFGRLARWRKDRIGGTVWYLDCKLAEGCADLTNTRELKALPRLGSLPSGQRLDS